MIKMTVLSKETN